jgi:Fe-S-cluster-containing hydrogenase component 2
MAKRKRIVYKSRPWEATGICSGCHLCEFYCSLQHNGAFNPLRSRIRIVELKTGVDVPVTCQQCENPACQSACKLEAIVYDEKLKIGVIDEEKCTGCQACVGACPYGIITIDPGTHKAIKCDLCGGEEPACVAICPSRVLGIYDDQDMSDHNRLRFAAVLACEDEFLRSSQSGEDPTQKKLEIRG